MVDRPGVYGSGVNVCEDGEVYWPTDYRPHISSGGSFKDYPRSLFKFLGYTTVFGWCFGADGSVANGHIHFYVPRAAWECVDPEQLFNGFNTHDYNKMYIYHDTNDHRSYEWLVEPSLANHSSLPCKTAFETAADLDAFVNTFRGHRFPGFWENQEVLWVCKVERLSVSKKEWDELDDSYKLDTRLLNADIRDCKTKFDEKRNTLTEVYYSTPNFLYGAKSERKEEYILAKGAKND